MASVTLTVTEATPLIGVVPAQDAKAPRTAASSVEFGFLLTPAGNEPCNSSPAATSQAVVDSLLSRLARLWRRCFSRFDPCSIPVGQALTEEQMEMVLRYPLVPSVFFLLVFGSDFDFECAYYNSMPLYSICSDIDGRATSSD
jgi:hypothetical protein